MSYTTPIIDRTQSDITAKNSKAFLNVTDWERIYENALETNNCIAAKTGTNVEFTEIGAISTATVPTKTMVNTLCGNIENMRVWEESIFGLGLAAVKHNWLEGYSQPAPSYTHVNQWENTVDKIYWAVDGLVLITAYIVDENANQIVDENGNYLTTEILE